MVATVTGPPDLPKEVNAAAAEAGAGAGTGAVGVGVAEVEAERGRGSGFVAARSGGRGLGGTSPGLIGNGFRPRPGVPFRLLPLELDPPPRVRLVISRIRLLS